jgi:uncharacterized protein
VALSDAGAARAARAAVSLAAVLAACATQPTSAPSPQTKLQRALVGNAFERWRDGTGSPFELLADEVQWTILGSSPLAKTYGSREQFLGELIRPFNARLTAPLRPTVHAMHADGDTVIVRFDAAAPARDGSTYRNSYCWCMRFTGQRVTEVVAYLDTRVLDEFWARVAPATRS